MLPVRAARKRSQSTITYSLVYIHGLEYGYFFSILSLWFHFVNRPFSNFELLLVNVVAAKQHSGGLIRVYSHLGAISLASFFFAAGSLDRRVAISFKRETPQRHLRFFRRIDKLSAFGRHGSGATEQTEGT
jgi:hypothetical protein